MNNFVRFIVSVFNEFFLFFDKSFLFSGDCPGYSPGDNSSECSILYQLVSYYLRPPELDEPSVPLLELLLDPDELEPELDLEPPPPDETELTPLDLDPPPDDPTELREPPEEVPEDLEGGGALTELPLLLVPEVLVPDGLL